MPLQFQPSAHPENAELEAAFDKAYKEEFEAMEELLNSITTYTNGEIDDLKLCK